jgi:hypothetical protein
MHQTYSLFAAAQRVRRVITRANMYFAKVDGQPVRPRPRPQADQAPP